MQLVKAFAAISLVLTGINAVPTREGAISGRQEETPGPVGANLSVDVDYAIYKGYQNTTTGLNIWKGIRYAAPPTAGLRWRAPRAPTNNRTVISATNFGPICPQAYPAVPNAPFIPGNEDCLFLNVYGPPTTSATKLPVLVWIHGGGYGFGDGSQDLSEIINANDKGFIGVSIQYRLGAFGFLSSSEVKKDGVVNAGILDMQFALEWVKKNIGKFGGDSTKVTITGESAGGGAVMLLAIAKGGTLGSSLFQNGIASSPYLPTQYDFDSARPTGLYYQLASKVGCNSTGAVLECLRAKDSMALQQANSDITTSGTYGTWSYLPVTDGTFIKNRPSVALSKKKINGQNILVGNNANEGALFVPPNISTLDDLKAWLRLEFPTLEDADIQKILDAYPNTDAPVNPNDPKFATNGIGSPTAVNVSQVTTGQQQRGNNIYAESTFVCPSYWLNSAYGTKNSWHYQYSVPFASHQDDLPAIFGPSAPNQSPEFSLAFRKIWGNFVKSSNPSAALETIWPPWEGNNNSKLLNLNETGGTPYQTFTQFGAMVTQFQNPGLQNNFSIANAISWEGGRGKRCDFWNSIAEKILI